MNEPTTPACFACGSERSREAYRAPSYVADVRVRLCEECGMAFVWPRLAPDALRTFHEDVYDYHASTGLAGNVATNERRHADQLAFLQSFAPEPGRALELGAFRGELLAGLAARGWACSGIEPTKSSCEWIARAHPELRIHQGILEDQPFQGETFDLIVLSQMLEHVASPAVTLELLHRYAHPGTLLFVEVLSLEALLETPGSSLGKNFAPYRGGLFSRRALFDVLGRSGWGTPLFFGEVGRGRAGLDVIRAMMGRSATSRAESVRTSAATLAAYQDQVDRFYADMAERVNSLVASGRRFVCWGAGALGRHLAESTTLGAAENFAGWVEGVPGRAGREVLGHPVHPPAALPHLAPEAVVIASLAFADEIEQQLRHAYPAAARSLEILRF